MAVLSEIDDHGKKREEEGDADKDVGDDVGVFESGVHPGIQVTEVEHGERESVQEEDGNESHLDGCLYFSIFVGC